jgi:Domain of unknown function (DUF4159)/Aerotolerance regulator N-terminal
MSVFGAFSFAEPLILTALLILPVLYAVFRLKPPRPRVIPFPPFELLMAAQTAPPDPKRVPLTLLLLRLLLLLCLILAMAGPRYEPETLETSTHTPLLIALESDWLAAPDWAKRIALVTGLIRNAEASQRPVLMLASTKSPFASQALPAAEVLKQIEALKPDAFSVSRTIFLTKVAETAAATGIQDIAWISHGITRSADDDATQALKTLTDHAHVVLYQDDAAGALAIAGVTNGNRDFSIRVVRTSSTLTVKGVVTARDAKGANVGSTAFSFTPGDTEVTAALRLPTAIRNEIARVEIDTVASAGAVALVDGTNKRKSVGILARHASDTTQPLNRTDWYVSRALLPYADIATPETQPAEAITALIAAHANAIILTDATPLAHDVEQALLAYVNSGGMTVRFAGPRQDVMQDSLLPVHLRPGDRALGGALAWDTPRTLAPFAPESPFTGLTIPDDVTISRQWLAEPDTALAGKTWAALADGTPLVTADNRGKGLIVLFHVTSDPRWSNLPLSGLFVEMLRRTIERAGTTLADNNTHDQGPIAAPPILLLDGFGLSTPPEASDKPLTTRIGVADSEHRAGVYGTQDTPIAVNVLGGADHLVTFDASAFPVERHPLTVNSVVDLRGALLVFSLLLFFIECCSTFAIRAGRSWPRSLSAFKIGLSIFAFWIAFASPDHARAGDMSDKEITASRDTHFAYVITGDAHVDETSKAGLMGLTVFLAQHTALEPGAPVGVSLADDDLAVYPLLYWPILSDRPVPDQNTIKKIDLFMRYGGTIVFDTRDADLTFADAETPERIKLKEILAQLTVPDLEPVPPTHVITKTFYLITRFPGRFTNGKTWIEALPKDDRPSDQPIQAGDGVSPVIVTENDLAFAWAIGRDGAPLNTLDGSIPRQRELSLRAGVNIALYVLTGNYKADQVHVPALLERLGQ